MAAGREEACQGGDVGKRKPHSKMEPQPSFLPRPAWQELPPGEGLTLEMAQEPPTWAPLRAQRLEARGCWPGLLPSSRAISRRPAVWGHLAPCTAMGLRLAPPGAGAPNGTLRPLTGWGPVMAGQLQCSQGGVAPSLHGG